MQVSIDIYKYLQISIHIYKYILQGDGSRDARTFYIYGQALMEAQRNEVGWPNMTSMAAIFMIIMIVVHNDCLLRLAGPT